MPDISKLRLPSGHTYDIKDAVAREMIAGGVSYTIGWDGTSIPVPANIPAGVVVTYNGTDYEGTLSADSAQPGAFYLVKSSDESQNIYSEYVPVGTPGSKTWEKLGDTSVDLSDLGELAFKDSVALTKGSGDNVLGEATTFTNASSNVSFSGGSSENFVQSYPGQTSKLATTTVPNVTDNTDVSIPNVTNVGTPDTWNFEMGTGTDYETLIISGVNGTTPTLGAALSASKVTLGTAKTVATGSLSASGGGDTVMTGLGTPVTGSAVTNIGTGTAAAQAITVGNNDKVKVAKFDDLSVSVS